MIFLDSTVLIDYFNGKTNWQVEVLDSILGRELVVIGDYVLTEVLQGFRSDKDFKRAKTILLSFPCFDIGGKEIAIQSAKNFTQYDFSAPIMKATSGILVLTKEEVNEHQETPCLKCGKCIEACPLGLMPTKLARYSQLDKLEEAEGLDISVCMECGTCAYTCPANIPLVQWIRFGRKRVNENS